MTRRRFEHAANRAFPCAERVLLLPFGRESYLPAIAAAWDGEPMPLGPSADRIVIDLRGAPAPTTLVYSGMGSPAAANALEMAAANGARVVVVVGACGGVGEGVAVGDLVAVTGAVRGEGTSSYYAPPGFPAAFDPTLVVALDGAARRLSRTMRRGVVYTTDAGYRQGPEIYEQCRGLVVGVESECAAVAVVAARLGLAAGALLFVTDNVTARDGSDHAYRGLDDPRVAAAFEAAVRASLEALAGHFVRG